MRRVIAKINMYRVISLFKEREYFELYISRKTTIKHEHKYFCKVETKLWNGSQVLTFIDKVIPDFIQNVQLGIVDTFDKKIAERWLIEACNDYTYYNNTYQSCSTHDQCWTTRVHNVENIELSYPYGTIKQRRLVTFILGMDRRYGSESSINRCFNSLLGDKNILGLIKDYL